ncbi:MULTISPECIES: hypothetical protein [unclassified Streptomyces]|uniref:hypothetical protein n=1 Tax=unclassified Streptomyces TaxID=2593676 RepID=UPI002E2D022C|nr:hypothetical protein [Streptomyces sp. NBC_01423]
MSATNLITLAVALIALIGTVIGAILGPLYAQRARREDRLQVLADRRKNRLRAARDRFQDNCDDLQVTFASMVVPAFSDRDPGQDGHLGPVGQSTLPVNEVIGERHLMASSAGYPQRA